jgi:hypothetical protein
MIDDIVRCSNECGISQDEIHYEAFQIATGGDPFTVEIKKENMVLTVDEDKTLLQTIRDAGLEVDSSCETGNCGTCKVVSIILRALSPHLDVSRVVIPLTCLGRKVPYETLFRLKSLLC